MQKPFFHKYIHLSIGIHKSERNKKIGEKIILVYLFNKTDSMKIRIWNPVKILQYGLRFDSLYEQEKYF